MVAIPGSVPALNALPSGCRFHARCEYAVPGHCDVIAPTLEQRTGPRPARCLHPHDGDLVLQVSDAGRAVGSDTRSAERRVGKECVSPCRSRWAAYHEKKKNKNYLQ